MAKPKLIDDETKFAISKKLIDARIRETRYVNAIMHSAVRAAIQVLDTRIDMAEKRIKQGSEEQETTNFFLDIALDMVLRGFAPKVLTTGLERLLRPIVRSRQAYVISIASPLASNDIKITSNPPGLRVSGTALTEIRRQIQQKLSKDLTDNVTSKEFEAYKRFPKQVIDSATRSAHRAAKNATIPRPNRTYEPRSSARSDDTVVVRVIASAQAEYERQINSVDAMYAELDAYLRYKTIDVETAKAWVDFLDANFAEGFENDQIDAFTDLLFLRYEMMVWAYSIDSAKAITEKPMHSGRPMSEKRYAQFFSDLKEYGVEKQSADEVTYFYPSICSSGSLERGYEYGGASVRKTVKVARERLEYWIRRFPYDFEDLSGPTILQRYERMYENFEMDKKELALRARCYEHVLSMFKNVEYSVKSSYRRLKDAKALVK